MEQNLEIKSEFIKSVTASTVKKESLYDQSKLHYFVRAMYAGAMLVFSTAVGAVAADYINKLFPSFGKFGFAFIFSFGLVWILYLHHELVTSNMMYLTVGAYHKVIKPSKVIQILLFCTVGNIVGSILAGALIGSTSPFQVFTNDSFLITTLTGKLTKDLFLVFLEGITANIFVNIAILGFILGKSDFVKIFIIATAIFSFVFLSYEHVVANFGIVGIVSFTNVGLNFPLSTVIITWLLAWIGNYIGGGLIIGLVYAWYNNDNLTYRD